MVNAARYSAFERLRDGRQIEIRALRPEDRTEFLAAVARTGARSLYRRFFRPRRDFAEPEIAYYLDVDFVDHVCLVGVIDQSGQAEIIGSARYIVARPGEAEVAFAVVDRFQGQGAGAALLRHLALVARDAGLEALIAEVLPENAPMLKVFEKSGLTVSTKLAQGAVHVRLGLN